MRGAAMDKKKEGQQGHGGQQGGQRPQGPEKGAGSDKQNANQPGQGGQKGGSHGGGRQRRAFRPPEIILRTRAIPSSSDRFRQAHPPRRSLRRRHNRAYGQPATATPQARGTGPDG